MANSRSGGNTSSHNHNLVINNKNTIENSKGKLNLLRQAKLDLLDSMDFENTLVNRNNLANQIADNRKQNGLDGKNIGIPGGNIMIRKSPDINVNIDLDSYGMKGEYEGLINEINNLKSNGGDLLEIAKKEKRLRELDSVLAERCILDAGGSIEFKSTDTFESERNAKDESKEAYKELSKLDAYKGKIELISKKKAGVDFYVIKWTEEQIKKIKQKYEELLKKANKEDDTDPDEKKENNENKENNEIDNKENNEIDNKENNKDYEDLKKKYDELKEKNEEQDKKIKELIERLNAKDTNTESEAKDTDADEKIIDEEDNKNDDKLENSEIIDEDSNYISRNFIEGLIVGIRGAEGYPKGTIRIREEVINIEEFEFYEEFKQEYIEAKGDAAKLSKLDKEFAEMIILFSPKGADYKDKYCIKLSEAELKDGLYVSEERLARYGVMIKVSEYFEKVIEREVIRERKIVEKIETTITELQTQIVELTTSISIERYNKEVILEEIKSKKKLLAILIKRYKALQLSLKGLDNDEELKQLKEDEKKLQKELKELNKQKNIFNEIKKALDAISADQESVYIITRDGKVCYLHGNGKRFTKGQDETDLFKESGFRQNELLDVLKKRSGDIKEVIIGEENMPNKPQKFPIPENIEDIDKKIADIEKQLADIKERIKQKEASNKKRVVVEEFDDSDGGAWFARYCEENGIKRKDGKEISRKGGMDTSAIYVDKNGRELKLEWNDGADQHDDAGSHTKYELVYYEESGNGKKSELETQLTILIEEWEALLVELTGLERKLIVAKTEEEKIEIKKKIKIINKKLVIISQKYTKFEQFIHIYKSKIKITKYSIFQIVPFGPIPVPVQGLQLNSVISDMGTDVFKEKAALKVEEELKRQYNGLGRWQMGSRLALFLGRGSKRKKMMKKEMKNMANTAFQTDAAYTTLNEQSQNAADRHGHELVTNMDAVNRITSIHNKDIDQLCKDYLMNRINDTAFQQRFNQIIANDNDDISNRKIQDILNGQNITHIGTNILLQLKEQKALNTLIRTLDGQLNSYIATGNPIHMHNMQNYVEQYIKDYQKLPAFRTTFEQFLQGNLNARNQLRRYLSHQKGIMNMQITNLRMNIDILNKGKSAYQIDNKDREKGWKYKVGHFMDKHPRGTAAGSVALAVGLGVVTAGTSAVAGAAISTGVFGSYVGFTNYIKKWTHHTKEQNTHEKNVVTDYRNEQAKIQNWQNLALNGHGRKKYKAKRQLALYDQTTQENIQLSDQITEYITNLSSKTGALTPNEDNFMRLNLIEGWARLKYYRAMGHNFLASEKVDETEKDMRRLEKAITLGLQKIGKNTNDIEQNMIATNPQGTNITYAVIQNDLKASYDKSLIQFKRERRNLALKYGISTAVASIGASLAFQYAFGNGIFSHETPAYNASTTTADYYNLGKADGLSQNIASDTKAALSSIPDPKGANVNLLYGGGTDGTQVIPGRLPPSDLAAKIADVKNDILALGVKNPGTPGSGLTLADQTTFLSELNSLSGGTGTNGILQNMRHADDIRQLAVGLSDSCKSGIVNPVSLARNSALDVVGTVPHTAGDRVANAIIEVSRDGIPGKKCWFFGVPLFFNTFKKRKPTKDTTDQNFGQGNNQQRPNQPRQPQPNQNQPHNP